MLASRNIYLRLLAAFSACLLVLSFSRSRLVTDLDDEEDFINQAATSRTNQKTLDHTLQEPPKNDIWTTVDEKQLSPTESSATTRSKTLTLKDSDDDYEDVEEQKEALPSKPERTHETRGDIAKIGESLQTDVTKKKTSLSELAARLRPARSEAEEVAEEDYVEPGNTSPKKPAAPQPVTTRKETIDATDREEDEDAGQEEGAHAKIVDSESSVGTDVDEPEKQIPLRPTDWAKYFNSEKCKAFRGLPPGRASEHNLGQGKRSLCSGDPAERQTHEFRTELGGSIDISIIHRAIYIPVMKAGSQLFQEVFRRRLRGKRILDRELPSYLRKFDLKLDDFLVFTFVREPFSTFVSAYGEVSKYAARNRTIVRGFASIDDVPENEPKRAMTCLDDIKKGTFHGLVPAHMHTQLWKISRCMPDKERTEMPLKFIGHLDNLDQDWQYVEQLLNIPHEELPVIHSSKGSAQPIPKRAVKFDPPSTNARFSDLTKQVCDYYKADFACFGYSDSLCEQ